ncbi:sodium-coupled monocarboxylate transporter 2-like [Lutzomyia longipalpis]|uniref:sodium-coupled monocarboxylate transporter 2-like n=1 Tax=Lutzomyia longipalpis TaxID=7200 RepID=UPI002483B592|nr:sodium-coupled monocarboxylate transporter 2-like [Lutzomyia longipalpis]
MRHLLPTLMCLCLAVAAPPDENLPTTRETTFQDTTTELLSKGLDTTTGLFSTELLDTTTNPPENEWPECGSPEMVKHSDFTVWDYSVVIGMLVVSLGIGVFYGFCVRDEGSSEDFLLGSGMSLGPVALSLCTSFITAIELLGNPAEMFFNGTQFALIVLSMVLVLPMAVKIFYPIYFKMQLTSCYEYLGIRFGKRLRIFGAILYIIQMSFYTSVAVLAPAIALSKATGLDTRLAVGLIYLVCVFYASQGGMKAVVIADTFQACILALSLVLVVILGYFYSGTFSEVFEAASKGDRLEWANFSVNPTTRHTVFSVVIGGFFYWTSMFCTNQASVQKCMSLKKLSRAKSAIYVAVLGLIVVFVINFYTGLMVYTHYSTCNPLRAGEITAQDQLLPHYIMDVYNGIKFMSGIFVAGIFAASLGTVAAALNSLATVTCEDILVAGMNIKISADKGALYAKWLSLGFGVFSFVLVFIVEKLGGILQATLTLNGLIGGITLGLFLLGILFERANCTGAFYGGITSLVVILYVGIMAQLTNQDVVPLPTSMESCECFLNTTDTAMDAVPGGSGTQDEDSGFPLFRISYMWYSFLGMALTLVLSLIFSWVSDTMQRRRILKITSPSQLTNDLHSSGSISIAVHPPTVIDGSNLEPTKASSLDNPQFAHRFVGIDNKALKLDEG